MADSTERIVTLSDLQGAKDGYVLRKAQAFATYQTKKAAVNEATTLDEVAGLIAED